MSQSSDNQRENPERTQQDIKNEYIKLLGDYGPGARERQLRLDQLWQEMDEQTRMSLEM